MLTVSRVVGQAPYAIIHSNIFRPSLRPVTPELGSDGEVTDALPLMTDQVPEPNVGVFPARVVVGVQTV